MLFHFGVLKALPKDNKFWLSSLLLSSGVLYLVLTWKISGDMDRLTGLFWAAIVVMLWRKRNRLRLKTDPISGAFGLLLLVLVLVKSLSLFWLESGLIISIPFITALGLGLVASGFSGLWQYWLELVILCLRFFPTDRLELWIDNHLPIRVMTAKLSAFLLHYLGFEVLQQGSVISLPKGAVVVDHPCTGTSMILVLLKLALLLLILFPLNWQHRMFLPLATVGVGFFSSIIRVAVLAAIVSDTTKFAYWHGPMGAQIFSTATVLVLGAWCYYIVQSSNPAPSMQSKPAAEPEESTSQLIHQSPRRAILLAALLSAVCLVTAYSFFGRAANHRQVTAFNFPVALPLSGYQLMATSPLSEKRTNVLHAFSLVRSGERYSYRARDSDLGVEMRYMVGTRGDVGSYLKAQTTIPGEVVQDAPVFHREGIGFYKLFVYEDYAYLTACINLHGDSTVTAEQFRQNRGLHDLKPTRFLPWLLGQESFRDSRCLWALLSAPLDESEPAATTRRLEAAWAQWYPSWQCRFPRHLGPGLFNSLETKPL